MHPGVTQAQSVTVVRTSSNPPNTTRTERTEHLTGFVSVDKGAFPSMLQVRHVSETGTYTQNLTVGSDGEWEGNIVLEAGWNEVAVSPDDLDVTVNGSHFELAYNEDFEFVTELEFIYRAYVPGANAYLAPSIEISDSRVDSDDVTLYRRTGAGDIEIQAMHDFDHDGVYHAEVFPEESWVTNEVNRSLMVRVGCWLAGESRMVFSAYQEIYITPHLDEISNPRIHDIIDDVDGILDGAGSFTSGMDLVESLVVNEPLADEFRRWDGGDGFTVRFGGYITVHYAEPKPGTRSTMGSASSGVLFSPSVGDCQEIIDTEVSVFAFYRHEWGESDEAPLVAAAAEQNSCLGVELHDYFGLHHGSLDDLSGISNKAMIYITSHGRVVGSGDERQTCIALNVNPMINFFDTALISAGFAGEIVQLGIPGYGRTWAITPRWVRNNCGSLNGAVVVISGCQSAAIGDMATAFFEKGASAYAGWDSEVRTGFAFDVMSSWMLSFLEDAGGCLSESLPSSRTDPDTGATLRLWLAGFDVRTPACGGGTTNVFWDPCQNVIFGFASEGVPSQQCRVTFGVSTGQIIANVTEVELESFGSSPGYPFTCGANPLDCAFDVRLEFEHVDSGTSVLLYDGPVVTPQGGVSSWKFSDSGSLPGQWINEAGVFRSAQPLSSLVGLDATSELCFKLQFSIPSGSSANIFGEWTYCANASLVVQ